MKYQILALGAFSPLVTYALPKHHHNLKCGKPPSTTKNSPVPSATITTVQTYSQTAPSLAPTPETTITTGLPLSEVPSFSVVPVESLPTTFATISVTTSAEPPGTTVTTGLLLTEITSFSVVPLESLRTTFTNKPITTSTETPSPVSSTAAASYVVDEAYSQATHISFKVAATKQCGNSDRLILPGMPWIVANSMYNADQMVGKQCTNFNGISQATDGTKEVQWTSVTDVELVDETKDLCKGYTNIGLGHNLNKKLSDITSIPAYFKWDRTNSTEFRGSNLFDFITSPSPGDASSTATSEFMLWIRNWGNQVPIGYSRGPVATFNLFGANWKLYEGKNPGSGVTVRSMLVDENFDGEFQGDLKQWLDAMVQKGYISDSDYVTVGNAGTEIFYGKAVMNATVALDIKV
ncbi:glycoside hydrolase family 12 protein [Xylariaceae sp. AK1471]|nr:glycoside hydrolase family 12 protein [Xylariaceae sp. AK1471]